MKKYEPKIDTELTKEIKPVKRSYKKGSPKSTPKASSKKGTAKTPKVKKASTSTAKKPESNVEHEMEVLKHRAMSAYAEYMKAAKELEKAEKRLKKSQNAAKKATRSVNKDIKEATQRIRDREKAEREKAKREREAKALANKKGKMEKLAQQRYNRSDVDDEDIRSAILDETAHIFASLSHYSDTERLAKLASITGINPREVNSSNWRDVYKELDSRKRNDYDEYDILLNLKKYAKEEEVGLVSFSYGDKYLNRMDKLALDDIYGDIISSKKVADDVKAMLKVMGREGVVMYLNYRNYMKLKLGKLYDTEKYEEMSSLYYDSVSTSEEFKVIKNVNKRAATRSGFLLGEEGKELYKNNAGFVNGEGSLDANAFLKYIIQSDAFDVAKATKLIEEMEKATGYKSNIKFAINKRRKR